ncbi:MAG: iron-containing alcohol dehydrogenase [Planctomycetota bacterium]|jgi:alcohol dehydrogenase class IV|nr:iron-containing alcohol dehydrogenase [Planctomycetota bacterium]
MAWDFTCPTQIVFGRGRRSELGAIAGRYGKHVALISGGAHLAASGELARIRTALSDAGCAITEASVAKEPDDALVDALAADLRTAGVDVVLAIGGGSVLDAAKAGAALVPNPGSCLDYMEGIPDRDCQPIAVDPLPLIAVPTTAGTGSEVTKNAVIQANAQQVKRSMRHERLLPRVALVDPELLSTSPRSVLAAAGMDALAHLGESFVSTGASPMTDALAVAGLERALRFLNQLVDGTPDDHAFDGIAQSALWGGLTLAHARLGAAHGLVAPLGGALPVPHGAGIAALTGPALHVTDRAIQERGGDKHPSLNRLKRFAALIAGPGSTPALAAAKLDQLRQQLEIPKLSHYGLNADLIPAIAAAPSSSIKSNPIELTAAECEEILQRAS